MQSARHDALADTCPDEVQKDLKVNILFLSEYFDRLLILFVIGFIRFPV